MSSILRVPKFACHVPSHPPSASGRRAAEEKVGATKAAATNAVAMTHRPVGRPRTGRVYVRCMARPYVGGRYAEDVSSHLSVLRWRVGSLVSAGEAVLRFAARSRGPSRQPWCEC